MSKMSPTEMAQTLAKGLLSFPVTHFDQDFRFQEGPYREHCAWLLELQAPDRPVRGRRHRRVLLPDAGGSRTGGDGRR